MTSLSDTLTVGLVLLLLFGAVVLYLYTRIQQAEQKLTLLESILLDLKMSMEVHSYSELPAEENKGGSSTESTPEPYTPFEDEHDVAVPEAPLLSSTEQDTPIVEVSSDDVEQYKNVVSDAVKEESFETTPSELKSSTNYDSMTLKELQAVAKSRGITGASTMKKGSIIEALKTSDKSQHTSLDSGNIVSSFLETSSTFLAN